MAIDIEAPGAEEEALRTALDLLTPKIRQAVWWADDTNNLSTGTVDTTQLPYGGQSSEGQTVLATTNKTNANAGIWVLGSHAVPTAVPVTRRADAVVGSRFWTGELIAHLSDAGVVTLYVIKVNDDNDLLGFVLSADCDFNDVYPTVAPLLP